MRGICGTLIWNPDAAHSQEPARLSGDIFELSVGSAAARVSQPDFRTSAYD